MPTLDFVLVLAAFFPSLLVAIFATGSLIGLLGLIKEGLPASRRTREVQAQASRANAVQPSRVPNAAPAELSFQFGGVYVG